MFDEQYFPDNEWDSDYYDQINKISTWLPSDWMNYIHIPPPPPIGQGLELSLVAAAVACRSANDDTAIRRQMRNFVEDLWLALGKVSSVHSDFEILYQQLCLFAIVPIIALKRDFARGRPWHYNYFGTNNRWSFKVGHPAYPSGHATCAFLVARVLSEKIPARKLSLLECATTISKNREIAGVHFASDTIAGAALADQLFANILKQRSADFDKWTDERVSAFASAS